MTCDSTIHTYTLRIAMRRKERSDTSARNTSSRFQTPEKATVTASSSTTASKPSKNPSTTRKKSQTPISSLARSNTSRNRGSPLSSCDQQRTLTQLDFVKPPELGLDDDRLDYIDADTDTRQDGTANTKNNNNKPHDVIVIEDDSHDDDADYRPARPARGAHANTKKTDASTRRKSTPKNGSGNAEKSTDRRKSGGSGNVKGNKKKDEEQDNKTLTQMDFVQRWLKIESDDDEKFEYIPYGPKKDRDLESRGAHRRSAKEALQSTNRDTMDSGEHKRRRLTEELDSKEVPKPEGDLQKKQLPRIGFVTPKKAVKAEIPSSQSPESPGFAFHSPSHSRGINRSPLKRASPVKADPAIKKEHFDSSQKKEVLHDPDHTSDHAASKSSLLLNSPATHEPDASLTPRNDNLALGNEGGSDDRSENRYPNTQKTVIYETDAESDYGDTQDDLSVPGSLSEHVVPNDDPIEDTQDWQHDSQELPPPVVPSEHDNDNDNDFGQDNLSSDASICYQRPQHSTQFPLEPIPPMSTQKMAELFPPEHQSSAQQIPTDTTQTQSSPAQHRPLPIPPPRIQTEIQTQTQSQSQSQDLEKDSTEIVPESSPVTRQGRGGIIDHSMPHDSCGHESVVQVESSQPPDRHTKNSGIEQGSGPRGIMDGNQLLSSSVMESIPMPPLWMGSQDSVGEPYSDMDRE